MASVEQLRQGQRLRVPIAVLEKTFETIRSCGAGRRECMVVWLSTLADRHTVVQVMHVSHRGDSFSVSIDGVALHEIWTYLDVNELQIAVQVHSHPAEAFHSPTDDAYPMVSTPGFLSLVIPNFAEGQPSLSDSYLTRMGEDGLWAEVKDPHQALQLT